MRHIKRTLMAPVHHGTGVMAPHTALILIKEVTSTALPPSMTECGNKSALIDGGKSENGENTKKRCSESSFATE